MAEAQAAATKATEEAKAAAQAENKEQAEAEAARLREQAEVAEKARQEAESRLALERQAIEEAKAKAEAAEAQRKTAEEKAKRDAEELEQARRDAEEAEQAKREAEAKAAKEAEEATRARRAAAMVAKSASQPVAPTAPPAKQEPAPTTSAPTAPATPQAASPQAQKPVAQKPQKVKPPKKKAPPKPKEEERKYNPGDLICGECGEGNSPERKFCRKCGTSLAEADVAKTPWYKRFFKRKPKTYAAGERKKGGRSSGVKGAVHQGKRAFWGFRRLRGGVFRTLLIIAVVGGAVGVSVGPTGGDVRRWTRERVDGVKCYFSQPDPQQANVTSVTTETPEHPAQHGFDFGVNTYWQVAGGQGTATIEFTRELDITHVQFQSGTAEGAVDLARPREVHVSFVTREGQEVGPIIMADLPNISEGPERRAVEGAITVTQATVRIVSVHPGQTSEDVAVREIEFLAKTC
jgi:ribosomal protein L40E